MDIKELTKKLTNFLSSNFRVYAGKTDTEEDYYYDLAEYTNYFLSATTSGLAGKQGLLTAGENITIEGNVISSSGGGVATNIKYGRIYNYYAITNADFAPDGWHVPTQTEIETLVAELGGLLLAGGPMKETGLAYWNTPNTGATNTSGLNIRGGGQRFDTGEFVSLKEACGLYSVTDEGGGMIYSLHVDYASTEVSDNQNNVNTGFPVILIKDDSTNPGSLTDIDGNVYRTVKIGNQVWLADAWACTKLNDGTPIAEITDDAEWAADTTGAYCNYNNDVTNVFKDPAFEEWLSKELFPLGLSLAQLDADVAAGTGVAHFNIPEDCVFESAFITVSTAPTGSSAVWDINITGVGTILSTKITIEAGEYSSLDATSQPVFSTTTATKGQRGTVDCDSTSAGTKPKNPILHILYRKS